ncbi:MAG TPA: hypothetical protein VHG70_10710 [Nocardioidaceae bacterium]|nr:hypothetical protein [Nocardioidaceae bacterium]
MISNVTMTSQQTQDAARLRMPVGTIARAAMICADAEVYTKGTTVFADGASAAARPHVLRTPGARCWSPPV